MKECLNPLVEGTVPRSSEIDGLTSTLILSVSLAMTRGSFFVIEGH